MFSLKTLFGVIIEVSCCNQTHPKALFSPEEKRHFSDIYVANDIIIHHSLFVFDPPAISQPRWGEAYTQDRAYPPQRPGEAIPKRVPNLGAEIRMLVFNSNSAARVFFFLRRRPRGKLFGARQTPGTIPPFTTTRARTRQGKSESEMGKQRTSKKKTSRAQERDGSGKPLANPQPQKQRIQPDKSESKMGGPKRKASEAQEGVGHQRKRARALGWKEYLKEAGLYDPKETCENPAPPSEFNDKQRKRIVRNHSKRHDTLFRHIAISDFNLRSIVAESKKKQPPEAADSNFETNNEDTLKLIIDQNAIIYDSTGNGYVLPGSKYSNTRDSPRTAGLTKLRTILGIVHALVGVRWKPEEFLECFLLYY